MIAQNPQRRADGNPFIAHPDHLATGEATLAAVYPAARDRLNFPELLDEGLEPWKVRQVLVSGVERPNLWVDVVGHARASASRRCAATRARSTTGTRSRAAIRERAAEVGSRWACRMAQAFLSILLT